MPEGRWGCARGAPGGLQPDVDQHRAIAIADGDECVVDQACAT
jgi:hypothetical protein